MTNPHESTARARKAIAIAHYVELTARRTPGFDPSRSISWDLLISRLGWTGQAEWRGIAVAAGQRPASVKTQLEIIELLRLRRDAATESAESVLARLA